MKDIIPFVYLKLYINTIYVYSNFSLFLLNNNNHKYITTTYPFLSLFFPYFSFFPLLVHRYHFPLLQHGEITPKHIHPHNHTNTPYTIHHIVTITLPSPSFHPLTITLCSVSPLCLYSYLSPPPLCPSYGERYCGTGGEGRGREEKLREGRVERKGGK